MPPKSGHDLPKRTLALKVKKWHFSANLSMFEDDELADESALERYRQRYETWRYLDSLRLRTIQMIVTAFGAVIALRDLAGVETIFWAWLGLSIFIFLQWRVLVKINDGIDANGKALRKYGLEVGDDMLPDTSDRKNSLFYYIEWVLLMLGVVAFIVWFFIFLGRSAP